jgi:putative membrane-bound dehydrogenase-like protein
MRVLLVLLVLSVLSQAADFPPPYNTEKTPGGPMPAAEAARTMQLPPGFKCEVFAAEPDVQQPIAMAWDTRGRLWVAECYTYAENPHRWDTKLRDRIVIFEDADHDGHHDKRTVFYDQAAYLTSIEIGQGGVYMLAEGGLSFIADKDGNDQPDGPAQLLLDGFNVKTIGHNIVNGLRWGPDGWLYGRHGITDTSAIGAPGTPLDKRIKMNCGLWRYHPKHHTFETVLHGGTNSWGHDWDANGELFWINTVIGHIFHGIPGSYTDRMFGAHLNPHVYETLPMIADHWHFDHGTEKWSDIRNGVSAKTLSLGGGHAHVGCMIYNGGTWPKEYQGKLFTGNLHGNRINMERLDRAGCGFVANHAPDFLLAQDKWFRCIDLSTGPDGNAYILDWSDAGECHDNDGVHRTSGRIYKIVHGDSSTKSTAWAARMKWSEMSDASDKSDLSDGLHRLHAASALQKLPLAARFPMATQLCAHSEDAGDRDQPLMVWYGIEPAITTHPEQAIALAIASQLPTVRRLIARRLTEEIDSNPQWIDALLSASLKSAPGHRSEIAQGMAAALKGFATAAKPNHWDEFVGLVGQRSDDGLRELELVFGSGRAMDDLIALLKDANADPTARSSAFAAFTRSAKPADFATVRGLINDKVLGTDARLALAKFAETSIPKILLNNWPDRSLDWRAANVTTLSSRAAWAKALLDAIAAGSLSRAEISPYQARQLRSLNDDALTAQLTQVWGELRDTPAAKQQELTQWKSVLTTDALAKADPAVGKVLFTATCASCHKLHGEGTTLAPDLTGSDRRNLDYLLGNIVDPHAVVPADYRLSIFTLKDGRTLSGVIPEQTDKTLTVQTPAERLTLQRSDITEQKQTAQSLMPEGLLTALGQENVKHLIKYLMQ